MLCVDFLNILYKIEINRTYIEHIEIIAIKKHKKMYIYQHARFTKN